MWVYMFDIQLNKWMSKILFYDVYVYVLCCSFISVQSKDIYS